MQWTGSPTGRFGLPENRGRSRTRRRFRGWQVCGTGGQLRRRPQVRAAPGHHEIRLEEPRYEEVATTVDLAAGKTTVLSQTLKPLPLAKGPFGTLKTHSADKFAAVYVNDKYYGHNDEFDNFAQGMLLPAGEYTVRIEPVSGGNKVEKKVRIEAGKTVVVE